MAENSPARTARPRPRDFLRRRRPSYFSDTPADSKPRLDRAILEYHLASLTSRSEELAFEKFGRQLCEREICPNLLPHTGPSGGGDSRVDSETYPVSPELALSWYVGEPERAASERWGFAFSAKAKWRPKLASDIAKIAATGRAYAKAFFVSSQFIADRERADAEDKLREKYGFDVRIFDRSWILDRVFEGRHEALAVEALGLEIELTEAPQPGPLDAARQHRMRELEERIRAAVQRGEVGPAAVEDALESAVLARELEEPRGEVDGRFDRAARLAARFGLRLQEAIVAYERAWTAYWWFEDGPTFATHVEEFESRVVGTAGIPALRRLVTLYFCADAGIGDSWTPEESWLAVRRGHVDDELNRVAAMDTAPSAALTAQMLSLILAGLHDREGSEKAFTEMVDVVERAAGLLGFPFDEFAEELSELGSLIEPSDAFERLHTVIVAEVQRRAGEVAAGELHTDRAVQLYRTERYAEAIVSAGKALPLLFAHEARSSLIRALDLIADSYVQMGLPWAARGSWLHAAAIAGADVEATGAGLPRLVSVLDRLRGVELFLGRFPQSLSVHRVYKVAESALLVDRVELREAFEHADIAYDAVLGQSLLRVTADTLRLLSRAPDLLERLGLPIAEGALLFALGYSEELTDLGETNEVIAKIDELRRAGSGASISRENLAPGGSVVLESRVLGIRLVADHERGAPATEIAESTLAATEGLMATAAGLGVVGVVPEYRITVRRGHFSPWPFRVTQAPVAEPPAVEIAYALFDPAALSGEQQAEIRLALREVVGRIMARAFYLGNLEKVLSQLFGDERGLDRSLNFTGSFVTAGDLMGKTGDGGIAALLDGTEHDHPIRGSGHEWPADIAPEVPPEPAAPRGPAELPPDLRRVRHDEMSVVSAIDVPLWDAAAWMGVGYVVVPGQPPLMALLFTNADAAQSIWHRWRDEIGPRDTANRLQMSIVTEVDPEAPFTYRVLVGPRLDVAGRRGRVVFSTIRRHEMNPASDTYLRAFVAAYAEHQEFDLGIGAIPAGTTDIRRANLFGQIRLTSIRIRRASEVSDSDYEQIALAPIGARR